MNTVIETTSAGDPPADDNTLEYVKEQLLDEARSEGCRKATIDNKNQQWSKHIQILAEVGITRISETNRTHVKNALKTYRERPHPVTGKTKKESTTLTHAVQVGCFWKQSYIHRYKDSHLLAGAVLPKANRASITVLRDEDSPVLEAAMRGYHDRQANLNMRFSRTKLYLDRHYQRSLVIYCLAISSGLRRFEIHNLKIEDIDFVAMTILLPITKNREVRAVPMAPRTAAEIKVLIGVLPLVERTSGYLIRAENLGPMTPAAVSRQMERIVAWGIAQGMPLRHFTLHSLRHKAISDMLQVNTEHARLMAGHEDVKTTIRVYGHTAIKDVQESHKKSDIFSRLAAQKHHEVASAAKPPRQTRLF